MLFGSRLCRWALLCCIRTEVALYSMTQNVGESVKMAKLWSRRKFKGRFLSTGRGNPDN